MASPKTLPCLHSFCGKCVRVNTRMLIKCVQCKAEFKESEVTGACFPFIDSLSTPLAPTACIRCDICCDEDAQSHCDFCDAAFCQGCNNRHLTHSRGHANSIIPISKIIIDKKLREHISFCKQHPKFEVDTYCGTCRETVCPKCVTEKHSGHVFSPFSEAAASLKSEMVELAAPLGARKLEAEKLSTAMIALQNKFIIQERTLMASISFVRTSLAVAIENRFHAIESDLRMQMATFKKKAEIEINQVQVTAARLGQFTNLTQGMLSLGTVPEIADSRMMVRYFFFSSSFLFF